MTPVQHKVLTELPTLQSDCVVQAKTGTGKTIAFLLPALQSLVAGPTIRKGQVAVLIISPTRELALQIAKECDAVSAHIKPRPECHPAYGGTAKDSALKKFCNGDPKIVVATPGRLNDYLSDEYVRNKFSDIRTLVLDEADQMLEAGFLPAINQILTALPQKQRGWQGMCFSATIPKKIEAFLPKIVAKGHVRLSTVDPDEAPTIEKVVQHSVIVSGVADVYPALLLLLQKEYELNPTNFKAIIFGTTANGVALMHALFSQILSNNQSAGMEIFQLQSRLSQPARTKTTVAFKEATAGVMFASDVIGRGMDFPNVSLVIQIGLPSSGDQYIHRVGRTARAGNEGKAIILLTQRESFFLKVNKFLPTSPYPHLLGDEHIPTQAIEKAFTSIDETTKAKAYQAYLGFNKVFTKQLQLTNEGLVEEANYYAASMGCPEPPMIEKKTVGKMGLKGVKGLNIGSRSDREDQHGAGGSYAVAAAAGRARRRSDAGGQQVDPVKQVGRGGRGGGRGGVSKRGRGGKK
jgi:ATP-dependent RNA helicase MSS116, mitochondrial